VVSRGHTSLWPLGDDAPEGEHLVPLGKADVARRGDALTIVTWSAMRHTCLKAAETLAAEGVEAEVIDLRTLWPWDREAVFSSVRRTGRLLVAHESVSVAGFGAEIAASVAEALHHDLKAPVRRLGAPRIPVAYAPTLEDKVRVTEAMVAEAALAMMARERA